MTAWVPKELDAITDTVLAYRPTKPEPPPTVGTSAEAWSTSIASIVEDAALRLDAGYFNPDVDKMLAAISQAGMRAETLGSIASRVFIPARFAQTTENEPRGFLRDA